MQLSQKETNFLTDLKEEEQICVDKYSKYAQQAKDQQLKDLFNQIGQKEQQHLDTINQIMGGTVPQMQQQSGGGNVTSTQGDNSNPGQSVMSGSNTGSGNGAGVQNQMGSGGISQSLSSAQSAGSGGGDGSKKMTFTATYTKESQDQNKKDDCYLCSDLLTTEKHISSVYNTSVFEFKDTNIRNCLNHIQKEEQEHGEQLYNYMSANGMY